MNGDGDKQQPCCPTMHHFHLCEGQVQQIGVVGELRAQEQKGQVHHGHFASPLTR